MGREQMKYLIFFYLLFISIHIWGNIIHIPDDYLQIQAGIDAAADADTVLVHPGFYIGSLDFNGKSITVASLFLITEIPAYVPLTVIQSSSSSVTTVKFVSGEDSLAALIGVTIIGGNSGIRCDSANPRLQNLIIHNNNTSSDGGGISCIDSSPTLSNIAINYNSSDDDGGGIYLSNSNPQLTNVTFLANSATRGGGIFMQNSSPTLTAVAFEQNSAEKGGGIYLDNSIANMSDLIFISNSAMTEGGAVSIENGSESTFTGIGFSGNSSADKAGALYCENASFNVSDSYFNNNSAVEEGGAIYLTGAGCELSSVSFYHNHSTEGGSIFSSNSQLTMSECSLDNNFTSENGAGILAEQNSILDLSFIQITNNESTEKGAGLYIDNCVAEIENLSVSSCWSGTKGSGLYITDSIGDFWGIDLLDNYAVSDGGGIFLDNSTVTIVNLNACGNYSGRDGSALAIFESDLTIFNALFTDNHAIDDGTIYVANNAVPEFYNLTIVNNLVEDKGSAVYCSNGTPTMINCIAAFNAGSHGFYLSNGSALISYSNFFENEGGNFHGLGSSIGANITVNANNTPCDEFYNIQFNPFFLNGGPYPYSLQDNSPSVNAGSPNVSQLPDVDLIGNPRFFGQYVDMGAFENQNVVIVSTSENLITLNETRITNHPNPFYPAGTGRSLNTTISFVLTAKEAKNTKLEIFNIKGQKVKTLLDGVIDAGEYNCQWNGRDENGKLVSSGQYTARLIVEGEETAVRKMMLLR
jgi:predicted outer membrane repeat protein